MSTDRTIPAHRSRHDMSLIGAADKGGRLGVAFKIDNGLVKGFKLTHVFERPNAKVSFADASGLPSGLASLDDVVEWLNKKGPKVRVSALVKKSVEVYVKLLGRYVPAESPPREESRFRYRYSLSKFDEPEDPTDLHLEKSFYQRRKMKERVAA